MVGQTPGGHDRATAGHNAGDAVGGKWHILQQYARMDGHVVHALLALFDDSVLVNLPGELGGVTLHLLQCLVHGDGTQRGGAVAEDPFASFVDVLAGGQVHDGIGSPAGGPHHLLYFFRNGGGDGAIADIGIDLGGEAFADDARLRLWVVVVAADDGASGGDFFPH